MRERERAREGERESLAIQHTYHTSKDPDLGETNVAVHKNPKRRTWRQTRGDQEAISVSKHNRIKHLEDLTCRKG